MKRNNLKIAVLGCGYVGLPLILEINKFYKLVAFDIDRKRIEELKDNIDRNNEFSFKNLSKNKVNYTYNEKDLYKSDIFIVTVPTPILNNKEPDLSMLRKANGIISKYINKNNIIIYESTFYPGTIKNICYKFFEKNNKFKINKDYFCGYSPERINPGDKLHNIKNVTKLIAASNIETVKKISRIYKRFVKKIKIVSSIEVAEAAKIIENAQRDINIAFMNEISIIFNRLSLNTNEILEAAKTKWNFINFKPGLVGGHCIGVDPYYLSYISKKNGYEPKVILSGRKVNDNMYLYIFNNVIKLLNSKNKKILMIGAAFKEDCNDVRNSQSIFLYKKLYSYFSKVDIYDPLVNNNSRLFFNNPNSIPNKNYYDLIILSVPHNIIIKKGKKFIDQFGRKNYKFFDLKNIFKDSNFSL